VWHRSEALAPYLTEIFKVIIKRQKNNNTIKYMRLFIETVCLVAAVHGAAAVVASLSKVIPQQPKYGSPCHCFAASRLEWCAM